MKSIIYRAALAAMSVFAVSCTDDPLVDGWSWSDGECSLSMDVGFTSYGTALDTRAGTGGTPGDAIGEVNTLQVLFYSNVGADSKEEKDAVLKYVFKGEPTTGGEGSGSANDNATNGVYEGKFNFTREDAPRTDEDGPTPDKGISEKDNKTQHMTFKLDNVERGNYRIYVVANMPEDSEDPDGPMGFDATRDAKTVYDLRHYQLKWNATDIAANNAMFGYFGIEESGESTEKDVINKDAPTIPVSGPMKMHAWLKRAVSKVTVAFDGTRLNENVWIYIKSVQLRDIPNSCLLGAENTPESDEELISGVKDVSTETPASNSIIVYENQPGAAGQSITTGNPRFPRPGSNEDPDQWKARVHSSDSENSLFFFENMQGEGRAQTTPDNPSDPDGSYKPQTDSDYNRIPDDKQTTGGNVNHAYEIEKDNHPYGTYIEVKAYYVNNGNYEVSRGDITYRFMLGKDIYTSFDAERSIHYKVTLQFNKNANDVDWHIDIQEDPDIYVPEIYYVSYNYNETTMLPVRIVGNMTGNLKAEIIENSWGGPAEEAGDLRQYTGALSFGNNDPYELASDAQGRITNGVCNGFLQLRKL